MPSIWNALQQAHGNRDTPLWRSSSSSDASLLLLVSAARAAAAASTMPVFALSKQAAALDMKLGSLIICVCLAAAPLPPAGQEVCSVCILVN